LREDGHIIDPRTFGLLHLPLDGLYPTGQTFPKPELHPEPAAVDAAGGTFQAAWTRLITVDAPLGALVASCLRLAIWKYFIDEHDGIILAPGMGEGVVVYCVDFSCGVTFDLGNIGAFPAHHCIYLARVIRETIYFRILGDISSVRFGNQIASE
jgi:hypothetical protein